MSDGGVNESVRGPMDPDEFFAIRSRTNLSSRAIAILFELDERLVRRWVAGKVEIPPEMQAWLRDYDEVWSRRPRSNASWFAKPDPAITAPA